MVYSDRIKRLENYLMECVIDNNLSEIWYLLQNEDLDPSFSNSYVIYYACMHQRTEALKLIMKDHRIDINGIDSAPIRYCLFHRNIDTAMVLLKDSRLDHDKVINDIMFHDNDTDLVDLFNQCKAVLRDEIIDEILEDS